MKLRRSLTHINIIRSKESKDVKNEVQKDEIPVKHSISFKSKQPVWDDNLVYLSKQFLLVFSKFSGSRWPRCLPLVICQWRAVHDPQGSVDPASLVCQNACKLRQRIFYWYAIVSNSKNKTQLGLIAWIGYWIRVILITHHIFFSQNLLQKKTCLLGKESIMALKLNWECNPAPTLDRITAVSISR